MEWHRATYPKHQHKSWINHRW